MSLFLTKDGIGKKIILKFQSWSALIILMWYYITKSIRVATYDWGGSTTPHRRSWICFVAMVLIIKILTQFLVFHRFPNFNWQHRGNNLCWPFGDIFFFCEEFSGGLSKLTEKKKRNYHSLYLLLTKINVISILTTMRLSIDAVMVEIKLACMHAYL